MPLLSRGFPLGSEGGEGGLRCVPRQPRWHVLEFGFCAKGRVDQPHLWKRHILLSKRYNSLCSPRHWDWASGMAIICFQVQPLGEVHGSQVKGPRKVISAPLAAVLSIACVLRPSMSPKRRRRGHKPALVVHGCATQYTMVRETRHKALTTPRSVRASLFWYHHQ